MNIWAICIMGSVIRAKVQEGFQRNQSFNAEWRIIADTELYSEFRAEIDHISFKRNFLSPF